MALFLPNLESGPTFDGQSVQDATDLFATNAVTQRTGVVTGLQVSNLTGMTASVASGTYAYNGTFYQYSGGSVTVTAASSSDRRDIVSISTSGSVVVTAGNPCGTPGWTRSASTFPPIKPSIPANAVLLGEIYVANTTASVTAGNIIDKTPIIPSTVTNLPAIAAVSTNSTAQIGRLNVCNASVVFTLTLPTSPINGSMCGVYVLGSSNYYVTVAPGGADTIDYTTSPILERGQSAYYTYNSLTASWMNIGSNPTTNPTGTILSYAATSVPLGYLQCDGSQVSRTTYARLYAILGNSWGAGDGTTTFNLPNLSGRTPIGTGTGSGLTTRNLTDQVGTETVTLTSAQSGMPYHNHGGSTGNTNPDHKHSQTGFYGGIGSGSGFGLGTLSVAPGTTFSDTNGTNVNHLHSIGSDSADASQSHNNMQPSVAVNFIVKT